jgi:hypothetical protein
VPGTNGFHTSSVKEGNTPAEEMASKESQEIVQTVKTMIVDKEMSTPFDKILGHVQRRGGGEVREDVVVDFRHGAQRRALF